MICPHCGEDTSSVKLCVSVPKNLLAHAEELTGLSKSALIQHALSRMVDSIRLTLPTDEARRP